jgi:hypothetical protein
VHCLIGHHEAHHPPPAIHHGKTYLIHILKGRTSRGQHATRVKFNCTQAALRRMRIVYIARARLILRDRRPEFEH